jgi:hypothetical protein
MSGDWRIAGQQEYLMRATWVRRAYRPPSEVWDHDHCAFCWAKFTAGDEALNSTVGDHWICERCYADFAERFGWRVV